MEAFRELFTSPNLLIAATILFKMGLGVLLGGAVGWERELHGRPAGIRTHMLIVLGVVIICEASKVLDPSSPARVTANIVTGIGFLGAGTILRNGPEIRGLTTAASIWAVSGIGIAVSTGGAFYIVAVLGTALTLATLVLVEKAEKKFAPDVHPRELRVALASEAHVMSLLEAIEKAGGRVQAVRVLGREGGVLLGVEVSGQKTAVMNAAVAVPGASSVTWGD